MENTYQTLESLFPDSEDPDPEQEIRRQYNIVAGNFSNLLNKSLSGTTGDYLYELYREAYRQYYRGQSYNRLPSLWAETNFPVIVAADPLHGGSDTAFATLVGWLFALQLSELIPASRAALMAYGYGYGGYGRDSYIFGYAPHNDPMNMRIMAAAIYAAMRGKTTPDIAAMRTELGTTGFADDLVTVRDSDSTQFTRFYVDLRDFLPTAPGPYAPGWTSRPGIRPADGTDAYGNISHDRDTHEHIVLNYNLDDQAAVQAIADKEAGMRHIFGPDRTTEHYSFSPVFGQTTIGRAISPDGYVAALSELCMYISSYAREILQDRSAGQYGRLRPGCSWTAEATPNSTTDLRRDVLTKFEIEDQDGHPTGYYDANGHWTEPGEVSSPEDYEDLQRRSLWANSYPSGHSAGIMGAAMVLMELMPDRADRILKAANQFAINRTIARYHWTSDTLIGRVVGSMAGALCRATTDFDTRLAAAAAELQT